MLPFDDQQRATLDELVEGVLTSRDGEDARAFVLYAKQLAAFAEGAYALQVERARQSEYYIVLHSFGAKKTDVIKALRSATHTGPGASMLGLKEAKRIVESAPIVLARQDAPHTDALHDLHTAGADLRIVDMIGGYSIAGEVYRYFERRAVHG